MCSTHQACEKFDIGFFTCEVSSKYALKFQPQMTGIALSSMGKDLLGRESRVSTSSNQQQRFPWPMKSLDAYFKNYAES